MYACMYVLAEVMAWCQNRWQAILPKPINRRQAITWINETLGDKALPKPMTTQFTDIYLISSLTHQGRVTHICVNKLTIIGSDNGLSPDRRQAYLNQCWIIVNWTLRNKLQWNLNRNSNIFIQENAFESVVCETAAILSRPQCVKWANHQICQSEPMMTQLTDINRQHQALVCLYISQ